MKTNSAENKSLFTGYSKKKLYCLAETYEELAKLYRGRQNVADMTADRASFARKDILYRKELRRQIRFLRIIWRRYRKRFWKWPIR